jgi:exonuclease III
MHPLSKMATEVQAIKATINGSDLVVFNVYLPSASSCPQTYRPDLSPILNFSDEDVLVMGDLNAHHEAWDFTLADSWGGRTISDGFELSPLVILNNPDVPTRLP